MVFCLDENLLDVLREYDILPYEYFELKEMLNINDYNIIFESVIRKNTKAEYRLYLKEIVSKLKRDNLLSSDYDKIKWINLL